LLGKKLFNCDQIHIKTGLSFVFFRVECEFVVAPVSRQLQAIGKTTTGARS